MRREINYLEFSMFGVKVHARGRLAVWIGGGIAVAAVGLGVVLVVLR